MRISYSRCMSYLSCPYAHYLGYVEKLQKASPIKPLRFGSDFHKLLEFRGKKKALKRTKAELTDKFYEMNPRFQSELGEDYIENLFQVFSDYCTYYKDAPVPEVTERPFEIKIGRFQGDPVYFVGVIDEQYEEQNKIGEHKTFSKKPDMSFLSMNMQKSLYCKAVQLEDGKLPRAVLWDWIHSSPAKEPIFLEKSNRLSMAANKAITPYSFLRACKRHDITDESVLSKAKLYEPNFEEFMFRREFDVIPEMVDKCWEDFLFVCKQIAKIGCKNKVKNITKSCSYCQFMDICMAEMTGGNRKSTIELLYKAKEEHKT